MTELSILLKKHGDRNAIGSPKDCRIATASFSGSSHASEPNPDSLLRDRALEFVGHLRAFECDDSQFYKLLDESCDLLVFQLLQKELVDHRLKFADGAWTRLRAAPEIVSNGCDAIGESGFRRARHFHAVSFRLRYVADRLNT